MYQKCQINNSQPKQYFSSHINNKNIILNIHNLIKKYFVLAKSILIRTNKDSFKSIASNSIIIIIGLYRKICVRVLLGFYRWVSLGYFSDLINILNAIQLLLRTVFFCSFHILFFLLHSDHHQSILNLFFLVEQGGLIVLWSWFITTILSVFLESNEGKHLWTALTKEFFLFFIVLLRVDHINLMNVS